MVDRIVRVVLRGEIAGFSQAMAEAKASVVSTTAAMTAANKEGEKFRTGLTTLGNQAGKVGLVAAVGLGLAVKAATDFNSELALVQTLSHASAGEMDKLSHAALTIGKNIGYSAKQVAQGEEELIKAGVSIQDILGGGLKGALDLAAAGQTDVATATSIAAAALTEFGLKGADVPHVADLLAAGADKALGSVEDLGYGLTQAGTTAAQMGFSIEQTVGTLAAFAQAGLTGERGGTTFKQMLLQLASPASNARDLMDNLGISLYTASGRIKTMPQLADNLKESLDRLTPAQRNAALGIIFGSRAIQGANILLANGADGIQNWIEKVNDQGFAAQQASGKLNSLGGDVKKLGAELNAALIGTGDGSQGPLRELAQDATKVVAAFNKLPAPIKGVTGDMLGITAILGGGLWFGTKAVRSISDTRAALASMNITLRDTDGNLTRTGRSLRGLAVAGGVLAGLAALDGALSAIDKHDPGPTVNELANALEDLTGAKTKAASKDLGDLGDQIDVLNSSVAGFFAGAERVPVLSTISSLTEAVTFTDSDATKIDEATKRIQTLDQALADLVSSTSPDHARFAFEALAKSQGLSAGQQKELLKLLPDYRDALAGASGAVHDHTKAAAADAAMTDKQTKALAASRDAARTTAEQFVGLGKEVDNAKVSLDEWLKDQEKQARALEEFTANAIKAGKRGLRDGLIKELEKAGPAGALRLKQLADGSETQIDRANRAYDRGRRAVWKYTDAVGGVPPAHVKVTGVPAALKLLGQVVGMFDAIPHDFTMDLRVNTSAAATKRAGGGRDGDPSTPYWGGGYTGDIDPRKQAGVVHGREMVFEDAATSGNVAQLDALRRSLASGRSFSTAVSSIVPTAVASGDAGVDLEGLVRAVAAETRPIFAPGTTFQPHNFDDITRQAAAARRMASVGGTRRGLSS